MVDVVVRFSGGISRDERDRMHGVGLVEYFISELSIEC